MTWAGDLVEGGAGVSMSGHKVYTLPHGEIHHARAEEVYPMIDRGSVSLLISDGPYGVSKAEWDRMGVDGLADWYAPHIEAWGDVCAKSATVYVWNTAEGWARLDPVMRAAGWTFRSLVIWDKTEEVVTARGARAEDFRAWKSQTEVCGMYQREKWAPSTCAGQEIGYAAGRDDRNWVRLWLREEWLSAGLKSKQCDEALGTNGMAGHYFSASQWALPTWEHYQTMAAYAQAHGVERERPYLVHPSKFGGGLRETYDHLREEYDHLREEYEQSRPAFDCPRGVGNVWRRMSDRGNARLKGADGGTLHPCQKPIEFYARMIRASSRPGEVVLEPFGGTCRTAAACEELPPGEERRYVCIEPDQDGRDYIPAVLADVRQRIEDNSLVRRCGPSARMQQAVLFEAEQPDRG